MKTKIISKMTFMAVVAMLSGCSSEDVIMDSVKTDNISFTVTQKSFANADSIKTRTTDSGTSTTFSSGDAIGIYVVNGSTVTNANLKYTYNGSSWSNTTYGTSVPFVVGGKYFAYYPYKDAYTASSVTASATTAEAFFASIISSWTPDANQGTPALYAAQDLMVSLGTESSSGYSFSMAHKMALVEVDLAQQIWTYYKGSGTFSVTKYSFDTYTPYNISNGAYRILVKPATAYTIQGEIHNQSVASTGNWYITTGTSLTAGTYKPYKISSTAASLTSTTVLPAVGDLYYQDGTYGSTYTNNASNPAIGVVVSITPDYCEPTSYGHGLVMALAEASTSMAWKTSNDDAGLAKCTTYPQWYQDKSGLSNAATVVISSTYPAFQAANSYSVTRPSSGCSAWFLASAGQWYDAILQASSKNNQTLTIAGYTTTGGNITNVAGDGTKAWNSLNLLMSQYSGLTYTALMLRVWYWTGSEYNTDYACSLYFSSSGKLGFNSLSKAYTNYVRPFLAF